MKATAWMVTGTPFSEDPVFFEMVDVHDYLTGRLDDDDDGLKNLEVVPLYEGEPVDAAAWQADNLNLSNS